MTLGIPTHRPRAEKIDLRAFPQSNTSQIEGVVVSRPQVLRTNQEVIITFGVQKIGDAQGPLLPGHRSVLTWAVSRDGGASWSLHEQAPEVGRILQASHGEPLHGGGLASVTYLNPKEPCLSVVQSGRVGWAPYHKDLPVVGSEPIHNKGPHENFWFQGMIRTTDTGLLACGCGIKKGEPVTDQANRNGRGVETYFVRSRNEGRSFCYISSIPNPEGLWLYGCSMVPGEAGYVLAVLEAISVQDGSPVKNLYQSYSINNGLSWSQPEALPIEGRSPALFRLRNGFIVLLSTSPSEPAAIQTVLSDDDGATWNTKALRRLPTSENSFGGFGNAQAVQLQDGTILCAYEGYTDEGGQEAESRPRATGIFVSLFDEDWVRRGDQG